MGMMVSIYRNAELTSDCTNNGVSNRYTRLCLTNVEGPFDPRSDAPAAKLVPGYAPGTVRIVPDEVGSTWSMFGGNYAATSDSRFCEAVERIAGARMYGAVAIHDRVE